MIFKNLMMQISIAVVIITTAVFVTFGLFTYWYISEKLNSNLEHALDMKIFRLSISLQSTLFNYYDEGSRSIINSELADPAVVSVTFMEYDSEKPLYSYVRTDDNKIIESDIIPSGDVYLNADKTIHYSGRDLGVLSVVMSKKTMNDNLRKILISLILLIVLIDLILIILIIGLVRNRIVKPIKKLTDVSSEISKGNIDHEIDISGKDEIGVLAKVFSDMRDSIKLQFTNLNLEIKDRIHAEIELKNLRNLLENIINSMPSVLICTDTDNNIIHWNNEAENLTNIKSENAKGKPLNKSLPELPFEIERVKTAIENGEISKQEKIRIKRNERVYYYDFTVYPLIAEDMGGVIIQIDDITQRVQMEDVFIQAEKMLTVGGLAAGMAHEINNPLAAILQNVQVLRNRFDRNFETNLVVAEELNIDIVKIETYMEKRGIFYLSDQILNSGKRASLIINKMLSFSRKSNSEKKKENIPEILKQTLDLLQHDYDLKKEYDFKLVKITTDFNPDTPDVVCDKTMIQQVFLNILKNGAQSMAESYNKNKSVPEFILKVLPENNYIKIIVKDNGPGMSHEMCKRIFEPFYTTKKPGSGTGLGLSVSYFIITENHDGEITVDSKPGYGARFIIKLPII